MNFISYNDCPISINGENFYAVSAELSSRSAVEGSRVADGSLDKYASASPHDATISIDYFVTGQDERILFLTGNTPCSGSFGGIEFSGAYLDKYSVNIKPYKPVQISTSFRVFSGYKEALSSSSFYSTGIDVANGARSDLANFNEDNLGINNPISIDYTISCERIPNFVIGSEFPQDVILGKVKKQMTVMGENIGGLIGYSGKGIAEVSITPKTINNISRGQTLVCGGVVSSQRLSVQENGLVGGNISIEESIR